MAFTGTFDPLLSNRECEILELVAEGLSAKEIASELGIAPRTVDRHIENMRLKVRAKNRVQMVTRALAGGQLELRRSEADLISASGARGRANAHAVQRPWPPHRKRPARTR